MHPPVVPKTGGDSFPSAPSSRRCATYAGGSARTAPRSRTTANGRHLPFSHHPEQRPMTAPDWRGPVAIADSPPSILEDAVRRFEVLWKCGGRPNIDDFIRRVRRLATAGSADRAGPRRPGIPSEGRRGRPHRRLPAPLLGAGPAGRAARPDRRRTPPAVPVRSRLVLAGVSGPFPAPGRRNRRPGRGRRPATVCAAHPVVSPGAARWTAGAGRIRADAGTRPGRHGRRLQDPADPCGPLRRAEDDRRRIPRRGAAAALPA